MAIRYSKIILPTRTQPDTLIAIFILKQFGESHFPGVNQAEIDFWQLVPEGETEASLDERGIILLDVGGGRFDHHASEVQTTASDLVARALAVENDSALAKLLEYARRDDFYGKGIVSNDPIDRAFGLSALIVNLNKKWVKEPAKVVEIILPIITGHYDEEVRRTKELPLEFEEKLTHGLAETFIVKQRGNNLKVVIVSSDNVSLPGFLRSQLGGRFDVVAQQLSSGHLNILTRPTKRVDLRKLAAALRLEEAKLKNQTLRLPDHELTRPGRIDEIPEWYYDPATNSIQNGGINPKDIAPTKIARDQFKTILELGLGETTS